MKNFIVKNYTRPEIEEYLIANSMSLVKLLRLLQNKGYLLHGSPKCDIKKFLPKKPGDLHGGWGSQRGVYATSTTQPIFFSLIHRDLVKGSMYFEVSRLDSGAVVYAVSADVKKCNAIRPGCVYIFSRQGFSPNPDGSGEWVSKNPAVPLGIIPTEVADLESKIRTVEIPKNVKDWSNYSPKYLD